VQAPRARKAAPERKAQSIQSNVIWHGWVDFTEAACPSAIPAVMYLCFFPSSAAAPRCHVTEAMACTAPVVASQIRRRIVDPHRQRRGWT